MSGRKIHGTSRSTKLRLAVLNSWPNLEYSAERELIARLKLACLNMGWVCIEVITSEDILNANVDCVIVTHEFSPKLTEIPTIGLIWSPPDFYRHDVYRIRTILSYDGYLAGSDSIREYLTDLLFSTGKDSPISDWDFLPTAPLTEFRPPNLDDPSIFYAGVHWDGDRHKELLDELCANLPVAFYGDPTKWTSFGLAYKGTIPYDGITIFDRINEAGIALCLHKEEHLKHDVPSMRIFESAAAGAVIITEDSAFAKRHFGNSVLYVDQNSDAQKKLKQIRAHFEWIRAYPTEALELAIKAHAIFNSYFALENLLNKLPDFLCRVKRAGYYDIDTKHTAKPKVEIIVRIGGRGLDYIERCLNSLAVQSYRNLGLILVSYREVAGLEFLVEKYASRFVSIKQIASQLTGFRSTSLWEGMRAVDAKYFCNQDDDDTLHRNHISSLVALLESNNDYHVAYSGCIQVQDEPGHYYQQINFAGSIGTEIKENRQLIFFEQFQRQRMLRFENFVQSNTWLARKSVLQETDLGDPKLTVSEDMYLYFLFLRRGDFLFSWRVTANWHWRSTSKDNSMMQETCWVQCSERVRLRTQFFGLSQDVSEPIIVGHHDLTYEPPTPIDTPWPRYPASFSEGIVFNKEGYPSFVSSVNGIAEKEAFGRWTDGSQAIIEFTQPLPINFNLRIKARVFEFANLLDKPIKIIVGNSELETFFIKKKATEVVVPVITDGTARSVIFKIPDSISPKEVGLSLDTRKLGLALIRLQIEDMGGMSLRYSILRWCRTIMND
jgi:Glycosyl transferase family 2